MKKVTPNDEKDSSAIIVGSSLSGLMAGIALAREGIYVTMIDKSGADRPAGAGLQVAGGTLVQTKTEKLLRNLALGGKRTVQLWGAIESRLRTEAKADTRINFRYNTRVQSIDQETTPLGL